MTKKAKDTLSVDPKETKRITIQFDVEYQGTPGRPVDGKNMAEPGLGLSIKQIVTGHRRADTGELVMRKPLEHVDKVPILRDLTDLDDLKRETEIKLANIESNIKKLETIRKDQEAKAKQKLQEKPISKKTEQSE